MKKYSLFLIALLTIGTAAQAQTLEEVLEAHFEIVGLEATKGIQTIITKGKAQQMGMEFPVTIYQKRDGDHVKIRTEIEFQGFTMIPQCYNGSEAWKKMPGMSGGLELQDASPDEMAELEEAQMEGVFYRYAERGYELVLLDKEEFQGTEVYPIQITKPSGDIATAYLDTESYVTIGMKAQTTVNGQEVESTQVMGDYDMFSGMAVPMSVETIMNDQSIMTIKFEEVIVGEEIDDTIFEKPAE